MKKLYILLLLLLIKPVQAQTDWFDLFSLWDEPSGNRDRNLSVLQNPATVSTDTLNLPITAYNDGWVYMNGYSSMMHTGHNPFMELRYVTTDSFRIEFVAALTASPKLNTFLFSNMDPISGSWYIKYHSTYANTFEFLKLGMDSAMRIGAITPGDTAFHRYVVSWKKSDGIMHSYMDGVNTYNRTGVTFNNVVSNKDYGFCIGNQIETMGASDYGDTYTSSVSTDMFKGSLKSLIFAKNDTADYYSFNQNNTQNFVAIRKIHNVIVRPIFAYEWSDRYGEDTTLASVTTIQSGATHGIDTMDVLVVRSGGLKTGYRDNYFSMSSLAFFNSAGVMGEGFGAEYKTHGDSLYAFGNFNAANGTTAFRSGWDTAKGVVKWNPATRKWVQLGWGLVTPTGTSGTMYGFFFGDTIIALGYDSIAVGVGPINHTAQRKAGQNNWSAMASGLNNVAFSGCEAYGKAYIGFFGDSAYGNTGKKRCVVSWNGVKFDSLKGGLDGVPLCFLPDSSTGERLILIGGNHSNYSMAGTQTPSQGLVVWSVDSNKFKSFHNITCTTVRGIYNILYRNGWYYFVGDFDGLTDGVVTTTSKGLARWKAGYGLQNIGTGIFMQSTFAGPTSSIIYQDTLYLAGSFSRINGYLSNNFAAIDLLRGNVVDVGYHTDMRIEGLTEWQTNILGIGDNFHSNGKQFLIAFGYNPRYSDTSHVIITHTALTDTAEFNFPLTVTCTAYKENGTGVDSVWLNWKKGVNGTSHIVKLSLTTGITYTGLIAQDTSLSIPGDSILYTLNAVDMDTTVTNGAQNRIIILANPNDYRTNLIVHWNADTNITANQPQATWKSTIDTLTARQTVAGDKPVHVSSVINGHGVMRYVSNDYFNLPTITLTNFTVVFAFKSRDNTDNYIISNSDDGIWVSLTALGYGIGSFDGTRIRTANTTGIDTNWHIATLTNSKVYVDGVEKTYLSSQTLTGIIFDVLGGRPGVGFNFKGDIADFRIYSEQVTLTNLIKVWGAINRDYLIH